MRMHLGSMPKSRCKALLACVSLLLTATSSIAQPEKVTFRSLESIASFAQALSQWAFVMVGGSVLVILHRSYYRPYQLLVRASSAFFLFTGWISLGLSVYFGIRTQEVSLAYLAFPNNSIETSIAKMNRDVGHQIHFMQAGLVLLLVWLMSALGWWVFNRGAEPKSPEG